MIPGEHGTARLRERSGLRRVAAPLGTLLLGGAAVALVGAVDPNEPGHYPTCPFLLLTGFWCPGCGALRTVHALAHDDVPGALAMNPLLTLAIPAGIVLWVLWARRSLAARPRSWAAPGWAIWTVLGVIIAYWVLRNLPGFEFLAPG